MTWISPAPMLRVALAALAAAALLAVAAPPSHSAFPGRDGALIYNWGSFSESEFEPYTSRFESALQTLAPRSGATPVSLRSCVRETGKPDVGTCTTVYLSPAVAPSGGWIAFDAGTQLGLMRFDGSAERLLPSHSEDDGQPAFSPDGRRLAFSAGAELSVHKPLARGIRTSDLRGGDVRQVTARGISPAWSTRGWIAFLRRDGVYRVRPNGHGLKRLVHAYHCSDVAWSSGGTRLAFSCLTKHQGGRLYVAHGDGSHMHRVAVRYVSPESVAWSPSGRRLALTSFDGSILIVRLDGTELPGGIGGSSGANYSSGAGAVDWQPLPRR